MKTKRNIARVMMAAGALVYLLGIWRTCPLFSGKGYFLGVLVMGMFAVLTHQRAIQWQEQDDGFIFLCRPGLGLLCCLSLVSGRNRTTALFRCAAWCCCYRSACCWSVPVMSRQTGKKKPSISWPGLSAYMAHRQPPNGLA